MRASLAPVIALSAMSAVAIVPSRISVVSTAHEAILPARRVSVAMSPVRIVASRILAEVTAPVVISPATILFERASLV